MSSLYTDIIQHAYRHPAHRGEIAGPTHGHVDENPLCGDVVGVQVRVEDGRIVGAAFQGRGCVLSQAAAELLLDRVLDAPVEAVGGLDKDAILEDLGLPAISPARLKCVLLSLAVLKGALERPLDEGQEPG